MKLFRSMGSITGCVMLLASFCLAAPAAGGMETTAKQAYIVDLQDGIGPAGEGQQHAVTARLPEQAD